MTMHEAQNIRHENDLSG